MNDQFKDTYDKGSLFKDIWEREQIVSRFEKFGVLDRNDAIRKIKDLRITDANVAFATVAFPPGPRFEDCPDSMLVDELKMQITVLSAELADNDGKGDLHG